MMSRKKQEVLSIDWTPAQACLVWGISREELQRCVAQGMPVHYVDANDPRPAELSAKQLKSFAKQLEALPAATVAHWLDISQRQLNNLTNAGILSRTGHGTKARFNWHDTWRRWLDYQKRQAHGRHSTG
jgi:hypothetical protein